MTKSDVMLARVEAFAWPHRRSGAVKRAARGYSLYSARTGAAVARLRPTGEDDKVRVYWWKGERWGASDPFDVPVMPLEHALDFIVSEPAFWIHA